FSQGAVAPPPNCPKLVPGFLSAVHFCVARAGTWIDPFSATRSISLQLARAYPAFASTLIESGSRNVNIQVVQQINTATDVKGVVIEELSLAGLNPQSDFNAAVTSPLIAMYRAGFSAPITILVDALDESLAYKGDVGILQLLASTEG